MIATRDISTVIGDSRYMVRGTTRDDLGCRYLIVDDTVEQITLHWLIEDCAADDGQGNELITINGDQYNLYTADNGDCELSDDVSGWQQ